ncbi:T-cell activation inhibitor, mitochondrial-like [Physella acuta]|uniref:T-cell activation inhibitor, mitochondrial-like n=1 Tax=Physella acuta TaxID=109671 RepID=UPI0027DD5366|nr:T-cell activation inhibitor, mitochondrial-like [Physella acuta]XP_059145540.1 T-cell activation inhibitor, mitochondrial-like [Physella acuta]XP_059145541.1 T-cell activation inhibitor, mitochondrial-like [Physella acuta]XP_059145542.1 T-cell activation inhibitor, mitochondrial-like [Physella acuta]XP_059145543.1 T-cell activation inhibitor, mitochondrial-like [Physella acuta]
MLKTFHIKRCLACHKVLLSIGGSARIKLQPLRSFTVQDASVALRPFFFIIHPDLFGQHPKERAVNENSLKLLNAFLSEQPTHSLHREMEMVFYIRSNSNGRQVMKQIKVKLLSYNLHESVRNILGACGLSTGHMPEFTSTNTDRPIDWHPSYYQATGKTNPNANNRTHKPASLTLRGWLRLNIDKSRKHEESVRHIQQDITRLMLKLQADIGVGVIRFDSVWGFQHFRGCLKSFDRLNNDYPQFLKHVLKGRTLVFGNNTGVSRLGEIVLSSEDVPQTWVTLLQTVPAYDAVLARLPIMEAKLSSLLNDIQVVRREKQNYRIMAEEYELLLNKILNSLRRRQDQVKLVFGHTDLSPLQLVVEGESSPMMLSSFGHFLVPASIPGTLLIDFIRDNSEKARFILRDISGFLEEEEQCTHRAIDALGLSELLKDESVTPAQMISCCTRFSEQHWRLGVSLERSRVRVSHYYSVMQDGQICVPWDWLGDDD